MNNEAVFSARLSSTHHVGLCRLCSSPLVHTFVDLGMSPPCESFVAADAANDVEPFYPLHAFVCDECFLVQLQEYVAPENIFTEYAYFSSFSDSWVAHAKRYCDMVIERFALGESSFVVELASNDGYLLQHFLTSNIPMLGIEPAVNVAKVAIGKGIPTLTEFFNEALATDMAARGQKADLIIGNNVLAQVPDINDFVAGMKALLKPEGVITLEFPHIEKLIEENQFDTIYHEHFSYFSLLTIEKMARRHGLKVFDVEEIPTHGGSLRVFFSHEDSNFPREARVDSLLERELNAGLDRIETYTAFSEAVRQTKRNLLSFLIRLKEMRKSICAYGAPGKGNTLLNYCGIGTDFIDFAVDRNPYKHGRLTPGMHIPIRPVSEIQRIKPDYVLILPWNLKTEIVAQMNDIRNWGGKFIVPIPDISIIDPKELVQ
ncbi:methyltransferase domain-containing protein [Agrobacterium sp. 22-3674b3]|jgi:SAM-dependent methyltransferase|uniref:class I SAM-dependent methyltransferase n=2 Tax=Rhizobiaceae TaxID=82115 RepID=UPI000BCC5AAB|nr:MULTISPECIES: class I SAM-dependent methyltransferase [Rhizobium/Agrobacterium group]MDH7807137.1 SAM-dependent methyltransferase [Rhizobium sp. AN67]NSY70395.1 class I SAM-dependent methyltransferase [Agrobacterium tumefaciens]NSZ69800.1 class I SAM-dependent methyltransferase [Agrobacterium tumefaciens]NTA81831.1 class I SAM-dependent methyltransferase [Agrobacterium tumefaciens]SOD54161.1 Methyltransferase domain-containing protein [Rhizobium sp. AN6A]